MAFFELQITKLLLHHFLKINLIPLRWQLYVRQQPGISRLGREEGQKKLVHI